MTDKIQELEYQALRKEIRLKNILTELKNHENAITYNIELDWATNKNPDYSNAQKRFNAVQKTLNEEEPTKTLIKESENLEIELKYLRIDISYARREYQNTVLCRKERIAGIEQCP